MFVKIFFFGVKTVYSNFCPERVGTYSLFTLYVTLQYFALKIRPLCFKVRISARASNTDVNSFASIEAMVTTLVPAHMGSWLLMARLVNVSIHIKNYSNRMEAYQYQSFVTSVFCFIIFCVLFNTLKCIVLKLSR